jgi:8-amino-7-oxononanoate synthase
MMVRAVVPPTVPIGTERVRICLHAGNTEKEIDLLVESLREWCERHSIAEGDGHNMVQMRARL